MDISGRKKRLKLCLKGKNGKEYGVTGKLEYQIYNGRKFIGFMRTGFAD